MTDTTDRSIVICGLPGSGKTTFLAALWHVVVQRADPNARLKFDSLKDGDHTHLNAITRRWQQAKEQIHTETASGKLVARASSGGGTLFVLVGAIVVLLAVLGAIAFRGFGRRRVLPALAPATASPAERAAADVAAFLPSPGITEPKTDRARPGPAEALATEPAIVAILPKPAPSPAQPALVPVPEEPAPLPEGATRYR